MYNDIVSAGMEAKDLGAVYGGRNLTHLGNEIGYNHIVNYARDCDQFIHYMDGLGYIGAGLEYAYDTIFGPIKANVHWSNLTHKAGFYISAGFDF